jgi:hypothetical protein
VQQDRVIHIGSNNVMTYFTRVHQIEYAVGGLRQRATVKLETE